MKFFGGSPSFISTLLILLSSLSIFAQWTDYTVIGRVLDDNGQPSSKADIRVSPLKYMMENNVLTDEDGRFTITKRMKKGGVLYLYVSQDSTYSKPAHTLIDPPFFDVNIKNSRLRGKLIKFGEQKVVDVGDVNVQFWFNTIHFKFQINGRNLTEKEWGNIWYRLKDEKGKVLAESSIGPTVDEDEVDLEKSLMKLSLPEGKWKLEFQKFNYSQVEIYPPIIAETQYFEIIRDKEIKTLNVTIKYGKCL